MKNTAFLLLFLCGCTFPHSFMNNNENTFDWQGHRGCRGLLPENSIPAFLKALEFPMITTLELDVAVSKDGQLVISHDPYFEAEFSSKPDGTPVTKEEELSLNIHKMTYDEVKQYDGGKRGHPRFPEQQAMAVYKPTFRAMVEAVEKQCIITNRTPIRYNIEIKSRLSWDGIYTPDSETFVRLVLKEIKDLGIEKRCCIQSFDPRPLNILHQLNKKITNALLVENTHGVAENLAHLNYKPFIYSPYFKFVSTKMLDSCHQQGIKVIPWTVNEVADMKELKAMGVDGIITDYPNRIF
jgi:glycerophosphoryl diester phosphodiesterase